MFLAILLIPFVSPADQPELREKGLPRSCDKMLDKLKGDTVIANAAQEFGLEPELILAVMAVESDCSHHKQSRSGAVGLMQVKPDTARDMGFPNVHRMEENVKAGAKYLSELYRHFSGDLSLALAGYTVGGERIKKNAEAAQKPKARAFVEAVLEVYHELKEGREQ